MKNILVIAACCALVAACESPENTQSGSAMHQEMSQSSVANVQPSTEQPNQATFVLVHASWTGGYAWKYVAALLRERGHTVYTPTLTGLGERVHLSGASRSTLSVDTISIVCSSATTSRTLSAVTA